MKQILFGLFSIAMITGCTTTPKQANDKAMPTKQPEKYAIQIIEAKIHGNGWTDLYPELFWDPNTESIKDMKVISTEDLFSPEDSAASDRTGQRRHKVILPRPKIKQATIDKILNMPDADTYEYPVLHAVIGKTAISDQTKSREMLKDCKVVDGKTVKTMETVKLGHYAEATLQTTTNACLTCNLKVENKSLKFTQTYSLKNGDQVEMPYYDGFSINNASFPVNDEWNMQAVTIGEETQNDTTNRTANLVFIRVVPERT